MPELYKKNDRWEIVTEVIKRRVVVRGGKKTILWKSDKEGYKTVDGKEVKMSATELRKRAKAGIKAARRAKAKQAAMQKRREKSIAKRTWDK